MARSPETYNKIEKEKKRLKKRQEKLAKKEQRKTEGHKSGLDDMIMYVDENGNFTDTPPDPTKKSKVKAENIEIGIPRRDEENIDPVHKGKVEFFNDAKGFGFIKDLDNQEKYFVHVNGLVDDIAEGDKVTFELEKGMKGMNAVNVKQA